MTSSKPYWYLHLSQLPFLMALHFKGEDIEFDLDQWAMYAIKSVQMKSFAITIQVRHKSGCMWYGNDWKQQFSRYREGRKVLVTFIQQIITMAVGVRFVILCLLSRFGLSEYSGILEQGMVYYYKYPQNTSANGYDWQCICRLNKTSITFIKRALSYIEFDLQKLNHC